MAAVVVVSYDVTITLSVPLNEGILFEFFRETWAIKNRIGPKIMKQRVTADSAEDREMIVVGRHRLVRRTTG